MSDDILSRATRALREETAGDDASARFTRSRVMASVHDDRVKRRTRWAFLLPIAATFVAASAYGAATGKTRHAFNVVVHALGIQTSAPAAAPRTPRAPTPRAVVPPPEPAPAAEDAPPPPSTVTQPEPPPPPPAAAARPEAARAERSVAPQQTSAAAPPHASLPGVGGAAADPTFELYRVAHQAHFVERDDARALRAWDAYLRAAPNGALVPEARYNRALCLVRLRRTEEARAALKPFAEGRYGTYRREDAQRLLAALPAELVGP